MGRFGGRDLSYASDIDVLFVYDGDGRADFAEAERVATTLMTEIGGTTPEGRTWAIDADLRPEGKQGLLARSLEGYRDYWRDWALTWEKQALVKARPVAGDPGLGLRFLGAAEPVVFRDPFPDDEVLEIRRMKVRIERERIPPGEDPQFHLKLGRGSLSDVEFTVQLLQLQHGARHAALRTPETTTALDALVAIGELSAEDGAALRESYEFCEIARNYRHLLSETTRQSLPTDPWEADRLGRMLGYVGHPQTGLREDYRRLTRHARAVVERVFYGRDPATAS
jgi:glutamate-ammonia-ligase adenylyltransferase